MPRQPSELPDEHVLCYPEELKGSFEHVTEHKFSCTRASVDLPEKTGENAIVK